MLELFLTFFKIGLFTFGGGYAMIPLVQQEVVGHGWLDADTLIQYIGICESTPGPIAVNMATFVGSSQAGLPGAIVATLGVVLPSFIVILLIAAVLKGFRENRYVAAALSGIRPVVAGMILATGVAVGVQCIFPGLMDAGAAAVERGSILIMALLLAALGLWTRLFKRKLSPVLFILLAALLGLAVYGV